MTRRIKKRKDVCPECGSAEQPVTGLLRDRFSAPRKVPMCPGCNRARIVSAA